MSTTPTPTADSVPPRLTAALRGGQERGAPVTGERMRLAQLRGWLRRRVAT